MLCYVRRKYMRVLCVKRDKYCQPNNNILYLCIHNLSTYLYKNLNYLSLKFIVIMCIMLVVLHMYKLYSLGLKCDVNFVYVEQKCMWCWLLSSTWYKTDHKS